MVLRALLASLALGVGAKLDTCSVSAGADCIGGDLSNEGASSAQECCDRCSKMSACTAFTFRWNTCYFKSGCDSTAACDDCVAGTGVQPAPAPAPGPPFHSIEGVQTSEDGGSSLTPIDISSQARGEEVALVVDSGRTYQSYLGFGGAFTECAANNFARLSAADQEEVLKSYFAPPEAGGNGYTVGRVHMNSCDFSVESYSFDDTNGDVTLEHFDMSVAHDQMTMLPMMKRAIEASSEGIKIFASPWSPPAWMKTNGQMTNGGSLRPEYQDAWANYFSRFFSAYALQNVTLWGLTVQNEPGYAAPWEACTYSAEEERDFLKNHLGPVMRRDHPEAKIMVLDHNRNMAEDWTKTIFGDSEAKKYADGLAVHWYDQGGPTAWGWVDQAAGIIGSDALSSGEHFILATEAANCPGVKLHDWGRGWNMASDIMGDVNSWASGWTDWNLLVDEQGGPNHLGNFCDAAIIAADGLVKQPWYYLMGHFSRYLRPGMRRVASDTTLPGGISVTSAVDPSTGRTAVVLLNAGDGDVNFRIFDKVTGTSSPPLRIPAHSAQSYNYVAEANAAFV